MAADAKTTEAPKAEAPKARKLADDFQPNEVADHLKSGTNEKGELDGTLGPSQVERAATEALLSLRPQATAEEIKLVLAKLSEADPKTKQPVKKFKSAADAGNAAVAALGE